MSKTKKLPKYVTVQQHRAALIAMHQGTVVAVMVEMKGMEDRLRDEFGASRIVAALDNAPDTLGTSGVLFDGHYHHIYEDGVVVESHRDETTYEGNHLAPTPAEGAE